MMAKWMVAALLAHTADIANLHCCPEIYPLLDSTPRLSAPNISAPKIRCIFNILILVRVSLAPGPLSRYDSVTERANVKNSILARPVKPRGRV